MSRDPRISSARAQRVATPTTLPWAVDPSELGNGRGISRIAAEEAEYAICGASPAIPPHIVRRGVDDLVDYGVAIFQIIWTPTKDGTRLNYRLEPWPMQYIWWNSLLRCYQATTAEGLVTVRHGDGHWLVLEAHGIESWLFGVLRSLAMTWADRTYGIRYRSQHAAAHGSPAPIGKLPGRIPINSPQGVAFQALVRQLRDGRGAGVIPEGAEIESYEPKGTSTGAVFRQIVDCSDSDIAIGYLGSDGTQKKGPVYTPPMLEGVRFDLVELDAMTVDACLNSGLLPIWAAANFGDAAVAPMFRRVLPDPEADERVTSNSRRHDALTRAIAEYRTAGFMIDQPFVDRLARDYDVDAPTLSPTPPAAQPAVPLPESQQKQQKVAALTRVPRAS